MRVLLVEDDYTTTAYNNYENVSNAFEEQCDAYLVKPIEVDKLNQTLKNLSLI